jgi:hypothetical protein
MNGYAGAAQVTPSTSMLSKDDGDHWMHKLEAGALHDDDAEFFAFASPDEVRYCSIFPQLLGSIFSFRN